MPEFSIRPHNQRDATVRKESSEDYAPQPVGEAVLLFVNLLTPPLGHTQL